jgi:hypothetical protein
VAAIGDRAEPFRVGFDAGSVPSGRQVLSFVSRCVGQMSANARSRHLTVSPLWMQLHEPGIAAEVHCR